MGRAFTLIELLVTLMIIGIIAGILLPIVAEAKASAKARSCLSQMRQIGMASLMYVQDQQGAYPHDLGPRFSPSTIADTLPRDNPEDRSNRFDGAPVARALGPYVRDERVFQSPLEPRETPENGAATNYQVNGMIVVNSMPLAGRPHGGMVRESDVANPPRTMLWQTWFDQARGNFRGGVNRVACDGHARWQAATRTGGFIGIRWWEP